MIDALTVMEKLVVRYVHEQLGGASLADIERVFHINIWEVDQAMDHIKAFGYVVVVDHLNRVKISKKIRVKKGVDHANI